MGFGKVIAKFRKQSFLKFWQLCKSVISTIWKEVCKHVFNERMMWACIAVAVICICSDAIVSLWIRRFGNWLDQFYAFIMGLKPLLWILAFCILWIAVQSLISLWRRRSVPLMLIPVSVIIVWFIIKWPGPYLVIVYDISFKWLLLGWIISCYLLRIAKAIKNWFRNRKSISNNEEDRHIGLIACHPTYYEDGRKKFAASIATLVENTNLKERGITIGLTGEWGAGKTLVLKEIRRLLEEHMEVIEFYPWQSSSPENLIEDFFQTLASRLHYRSRSLGKNLENYADKLIELDIDKRLNFIAKIGRWISGGYLSINDARVKIESELKDLPKSVAIIIDDLDRLDKDELFETLRLVRNTAHFCNIVYIIAYDPDYTVKMLGRKGIENAGEYLHKIFMLSLALPSFEHFTYVGVIHQFLREHLGDDSEDFLILEPFVLQHAESQNEYFLNRFIHNYRQAVQFGQFLCAHYLILKNTSPDFAKNFILREWYYLQILRFFVPSVYDSLHHHPESFFYRVYIDSYDIYKYDPETCKSSGLSLSDDAIVIIKKLFSCTRSRIKPTSIALISNFYNYFANRVLSTKISESEFMDMLNGVRPRSLMMYEWLHRKPKVWDSVDSLLASHYIGNLNDEQIRVFIGAKLWWYGLVGSKVSLESIHDITCHKATLEQIDIAAKEYNDIIMTMIGNPGIRADRIADLIVAQAPYPEDPTLPPEEQDSAIPLVEAEEAECLFKKLIEREFEYKRIRSADDISNPTSTLFKIMDSAYNSVTIYSADDILFKNYALKPVLEIFNKKLESRFELKGSNFERLKSTFGYTSTGDQEIDADRYEKSQQMIHSFFEKNNTLEYIIFRWFKGTKEEKNRIISYLHLR